jgi:hypothetical protein
MYSQAQHATVVSMVTAAAASVWGPLPEQGDLRFANGPRCVSPRIISARTWMATIRMAA